MIVLASRLVASIVCLSLTLSVALAQADAAPPAMDALPSPPPSQADGAAGHSAPATSLPAADSLPGDAVGPRDWAPPLPGQPHMQSAPRGGGLAASLVELVALLIVLSVVSLPQAALAAIIAPRKGKPAGLWFVLCLLPVVSYFLVIWLASQPEADIKARLAALEARAGTT